MPFENAIPDRVIWVSPNGNDNNSGSRDAPVASIQLAIDRAVPGTAIMLMPGDYTGNFEFEKWNLRDLDTLVTAGTSARTLAKTTRKNEASKV